jgi:hypothetical protein
MPLWAGSATSESNFSRTECECWTRSSTPGGRPACRSTFGPGSARQSPRPRSFVHFNSAEVPRETFEKEGAGLLNRLCYR